jgi:hypothetical protein
MANDGRHESDDIPYSAESVAVACLQLDVEFFLQSERISTQPCRFTG